MREPVHHRTLEAELRYGAFQFVSRGFRIGRGERGEACEASGMCADSLIQPVVRSARETHGQLRIELLHRRRGVREHLEIDARLVHLAQS